MSEDPVKSLIEELGVHLSQKEHSDIVLKMEMENNFQSHLQNFLK